MSSSAQAKQISVYTSFVCRLQVGFLLSPFPIASVAVWITVFAHFERCLNLFQLIARHHSTGARLFCIWKFFKAAALYVTQQTCICHKIFPGTHNVFFTEIYVASCKKRIAKLLILPFSIFAAYLKLPILICLSAAQRLDWGEKLKQVISRDNPYVLWHVSSWWEFVFMCLCGLTWYRI